MPEDNTRAINILIGVGGTGAKMVEATLIQLLSGMIDNPVHVGLVDQDLANGNVARTVRLLSQQHRFRTLWSGPKNKIEWGRAISRSSVARAYSRSIRPGATSTRSTGPTAAAPIFTRCSRAA